MVALGISGSVVLFVIFAIHVYWMLGGKVGFDRAIPPDKQGEIRIPSPLEYAVTLLLFLIAALLPLIALQVISIPLPDWMMRAALIGGLGILVVRGVGGLVWSLLKPSPREPFHNWNIKLYTPICIFLALSYFACLWLSW